MEDLSVGTNSCEQKVQTQIRLLLKEWSGRDLHCFIFHLCYLDELLHANCSARERFQCPNALAVLRYPFAVQEFLAQESIISCDMNILAATARVMLFKLIM